MGKIRRKQLEAVYETAIRVLIVIAICWVISMLTSCRSVSKVESGERRAERDTVMLTKWRTDSVVMRDSVVIVDDGERRVERVVQWRDRLRTVTDTTYINRIDSISVPYPVEKKLTKWERLKVDYGGYALVAVIILLTSAIWLARRWIVDKWNK